MRKGCEAHVDSQKQKSAASEEPPPHFAEMQECFTESEKNTMKGCQYGTHSSTSGPFGVEEESISSTESAKRSDGSTVCTIRLTRLF